MPFNLPAHLASDFDVVNKYSAGLMDPSAFPVVVEANNDVAQQRDANLSLTFAFSAP